MIDLFSSPSPIHKIHNSNDDNIKCKQQYNRSLFPKKFNFDNSQTTKSIFPISSQDEIRIPNFRQEIKEFQDPQLASTFSQTHSDKNLFSYGQQKSQVNLNVLIAGSQGIGKSTFVDVFLNKKPIQRFSEANDNSSNNFQESLGLLEFENQIVYLNIFDTKGFQKNDLKVWFKNIRHFINSKFKTQVRRNKYAFLNKTIFSQMSNLVNDERIHLCLYFLSGPINIKEDLVLIQKLSNLVNVIPILAKGDQYTKLEVLELKQRYNNLFIQNKIDLFDCLKINDELFKQQLLEGEFGQCSPFMVISSTSQYIDENGKIIQGRQYPWGFCDLWNPKHSDFQLLFKALIGYYLFDLIKLTDFYQHSYIKNKKESQKKVNSKFNFFNQILLHINQILYLID